MPANQVGRAVLHAWRRASFCASGECIEVTQRDDMILLRDSAQPSGGKLRYPAATWESFVRTIKSGKLDSLR
jgi:hypothetical protein